MFTDTQAKLKCWFQRLAARPNYGRYEKIDKEMEAIDFQNTCSQQLLCLDDVKAYRVHHYGVEDVVKYTRDTQSIYVKHVFIDKIKGKVKPVITAADIDFFRSLDHLSMYCYVLVYVKDPQTKYYDSAFFLDDYEAIQGIDSTEAEKRLAGLDAISKIIRSILL
ncbi:MULTISPECIES: hypothetical protein [Pseudoalteromonas]|uniref:Uncharacterized protein n=1 Tax=Pseudoalteromonas aurantia 208 TaxID=1314867 RepID=A0ABR9E6S0_9GAMM|nr:MULTISPECIES: hypothetical protein [Pseudoalteromonas]MBE0366437.1 hypothetical protein [Pseudoalteromonas aurantia 208]MBQ4846554.1 hypothetical protein [Pseudoalteromonas sp. MMG005]MBQ4851092.1 hypothetical protein [Pseudoalteromonas sp. MMG012]